MFMALIFLSIILIFLSYLIFPMDNTTAKTTPKDVFLHLFNIVTFYLSVVGFIMLYIQYINAQFPDALNYYFTAIAYGVRMATAILFIALPAYLLTAWLLAKDLAVAPDKRELKLRKWLVYFTLFISAVTIIVDLIIFVYNFLNGELTTQFFLKVLVVLVVAGAVFGYYLWDLKRKILQSKTPTILAIVVAVIAAASIAISFFIVGTPAEQRDRRFDEQRVHDLQLLQDQIVNYWTRKDVLPAALNDLEDNISGFIAPKDPGTKQPYEYAATDLLAFELCATFARTNQDAKSIPYGSFQQNWHHETSRTCFARTIDPQLYKINKNEQAPIAAPVR